MANGAVGSGANQFVAFFESDDAAPIRAEMPARPKGHRDSRGGEQNAEPFAERTCGKEAIADPAITGLRLRKKIKAQCERQRVGKTLRPGLALLGFLPLERGNEPVRAKEKPQRLNPLP